MSAFDTFRCEYSEEDSGYIATFTDYPTLSAFGDTPEEATFELLMAYRLVFDSASAALAIARAEQAERDAALVEAMPIFAGPRDAAAAIRAAAPPPPDAASTPPAP